MSPSAPKVAEQRPRLGLLQGLQFKLAVLFVAITGVLFVTAWFIGRTLVRDRLAEDAQRYQLESGLRLVQVIQQQLDRAHVLGHALVGLVGDGEAGTWAQRVPRQVAASGLGTLVAGIGVWPEPRQPDKTYQRASRFWVADSAGLLQARDDYNDPRAIAYWEEPWYTPARHALADSCFWTTAFREALSGREVVACTIPLQDERDFAGAVTVLLAVAGIEQVLREAAPNQTGYTLLADRDDHLLAASGTALHPPGERAPRNIAALARQQPSLNGLALDLHRHNEAFVARAVQSRFYDPALIAALTERTRNGSRHESESALTLIWNARAARVTAAATEPLRELRIADDGLLGEAASAMVFELPDPYWKLVRVTRAREGLAGAEHLFTQTLTMVGGALLLTLALVFGVVRTLVLSPLRRITSRIADAGTREESASVQLDTTVDNEIGLIGHLYRQRGQQLREALDRALTQQVQLAAETSERVRVEDQALRLHERSSVLLATVSDAVIVVDARGRVEDMNTVAERLTSTELRRVRSQPAVEVFRARLAAQGGSQPDFAAAALAASGRIEHHEGLFLHVEGRAEREIRLTAAALRGSYGRVLGAVLVFQPREAQAGGMPKLLIDRRSVDSLTALPTRAACDRRLRVLLEGTRLQARTHAVIVADIDRMRAVNEAAGQRAGDELLVCVAQSLIGAAPGSEVFRLGGDAFAVVIEATDADGALRAAERLREGVANSRLRYEERTLAVTASFGVVCFDHAGEPPTEVLRRADQACAAAKRAGRNSVAAWDPDLYHADAAAEQATWVRRIRAGLGEGLFHLTTQWVLPADRIQSEGAVFDVSLALEDEQGFWAEPATFLPAAERGGLLADVERCALRQALDHLARNPDVQARLSFCCMSLSAQTVSEGATLELLAQTLRQHENLPPAKLCFVLNEVVLTEAPGPVLAFCEAMRSLGCRVAIDHLNGGGGGGASMDLIRKLPAEILRIDARHFADLSGDAVDPLIADSLIRLARTLSRRVLVAEIGDDSAREAWRRLGADYLHGPAVARASPVVFAAGG
ncbi:MAG: diguanylate cyclase domain-containing protein [Panacagrimonas sp.]